MTGFDVFSHFGNEAFKYSILEVKFLTYQFGVVVQASGCYDKVINIWNPKIMELVHTFTGHRGPVSVSLICISLIFKYLRLMETDNCSLPHFLTSHIFQGLAFRKGFHQLYSASHDRSVKVWNLEEMAYVETL